MMYMYAYGKRARGKERSSTTVRDVSSSMRKAQAFAVT